MPGTFALMSLPLIAAVALTYRLADPAKPWFPRAVTVAIRDDQTGESAEFWSAMLSDQTGKCFYQPASWKSMAKREEVDCSIKAQPIDRNYPTVIAHFVVKTAGGSIQMDRMLEVWDEKPDPKQWSNVNGTIKAAAYRCGTVIMM